MTDFVDEQSVSTLKWTCKPFKTEFGAQDGKGIKVFMVKLCFSEFKSIMSGTLIGKSF